LKFKVTRTDGKDNGNEKYLIVNTKEPYAGLVADLIESEERCKNTWEHGEDKSMRSIMGICGINKMPKLSIPMMVKKAWHNHRILKGFLFDRAHFPTDIALIHSEVSKALEAHRKEEGKERISEELADVILRVAVVCGDMEIDIEDAILRKMAKNSELPYKHGGKLY